jgi:hypothetical protein
VGDAVGIEAEAADLTPGCGIVSRTRGVVQQELRLAFGRISFTDRAET